MKRTKQTLVDDEERFSISRFLGFHVNTISSPSEDTHLDVSHLPPTKVNPPVDKSVRFLLSKGALEIFLMSQILNF